MEIILIVYIVGFITAYVFTKFIRNKNNSNEWCDVLASTLMAILSWIGFAIVLSYFITKYTKPPKFL